MTDATLRELERRFRASGSVEDEAAWLRARVQAGELEQSRLELAAYLGDLPSRAVLGEDAPDRPEYDTDEWFERLAEYGECVVKRALPLWNGKGSTILRRVREAIVPWALGYSDPVREDLEACRLEVAGE